MALLARVYDEFFGRISMTSIRLFILRGHSNIPCLHELVMEMGFLHHERKWKVLMEWALRHDEFFSFRCRGSLQSRTPHLHFEVLSLGPFVHYICF